MILGIHKPALFFCIVFSSFSLHSKPIEGQFAEIQILDKITAKVKTYEIYNNSNLNVDTLIIEVYACYKNPPEEIPEDYVLLRISDHKNKENNKLVYQGWMISSSPASTPLEHPVYDLWLKDCKLESDF